MYLLYGGEVALHFDLELAFHLRLVHFASVGWVGTLVLLHVLEVVLFLEVLVKSVLHLDPTKEELDSVSLLVNVELIELLFILICKLLRHEQLHQLGFPRKFSLFYASNNLHGVLVPVLSHLLQVLADLVVGVKCELIG